MAKRIISLLLFFMFLNVSAQVKELADSYIKEYRELAMQHMIDYKIPASITLAQGIIESNYGRSELATKANNHFGIKCHEWKGKKYYYDDDLKHECFRKYKSAEESYNDHSIFLTTRERYNKLFDLDISDYKGWANGLKKAGYATNPKYPQLLIKTIEDNELYKYDQYVLGQITEDELYGRKHHIAGKVKTDIEFQKVDEEIFQNGLFLHFAPGTCDCMNEAIFVEMYSGRGIYSYNGVFATFVGKGDNLESISRDLNVSKRKLLKYNDLPKDAVVEYEDIIYLGTKNKRGHQKYHEVKYDNETLWSISQCYTVVIKKLQKKNHVEQINRALKVGTKVKLK